MKWKNKGHEFDKLAKNLANSKVYLFGAGEIGYKTYEYIERDKFLGFIDNNKEKQKQGFANEQVYALEQIHLQKNEFVVICATIEEYAKEMKEQLMLHEVMKEQIINWDLYIQVRELYERGRVIINGIINVSLTERCTLNCKHCSIMTSYIKNKVDYELEKKLQDIHTLFKKVDYVRVLGIVGGEPFLYKQLWEYIEEISCYREKIGEIGIVTNGTLIPEDKVLLALKKHNIYVTISWYPDVVPNLHCIREKLISKLEEFGVRYICVKADRWVDYMCSDIKRKSKTEELIDFFSLCHTQCRLLESGKIYYCATGKFMERAIDFEKEDTNNIYNLCTDVNCDLWKRELIEFDNGYSNDGYIKACKYCNGDIGINENYVEIAQQVE